jgi:hypothetical protein
VLALKGQTGTTRKRADRPASRKHREGFSRGKQAGVHVAIKSRWKNFSRGRTVLQHSNILVLKDAT